jgi:hypothetical protein
MSSEKTIKSYIIAYKYYVIMRTLALTYVFNYVNGLIMKTPKYYITTIEKSLKVHKIATFDQLKTALGNPARCTIFRKLAEIEYLSSYSHRGKYYTLRSIAKFNALGLWEYRSVWFSRFGNLIDTAEALVLRSKTGYTATELKNVLQVDANHALAQLVRSGRLQRDRFGSAYIYLSGENQVAQRQRKDRKIQSKRSSASLVVVNPDLAAEEAKATILLFCSMLDERQRRLYAGLESLKLGHGGDVHIASLLGMDPHTVARGRQELISADFSTDRLREEGGGRLPQEKKRPKS